MDRAARLGADAGYALALAGILGLGWYVRAASDLAILNLPDSDDVMRLQQVRDWLAGQSFADLSQHRLAGGVPMHWSRLADLGPALGISGLTPLFGQHLAEVITVSLWPLLLFATALFLTARVARIVAGAAAAPTAAVLAALAYPSTTVFLPGRIDHHGLQLVLLAAAILCLVVRATWRTGLIAGLLAAASLVVGMELVFPIAAVGAMVLADWVGRRDGARAQLAGLAGGAVMGLILARGVFAGSGWRFPACDGFTSDAFSAALALAMAPLLISALPSSTWNVPTRLGVAAIGTAVAAAVALAISPDCRSPYGAVDPLLALHWLSQVEEAQPLFRAPVASAVGYGGMMLAGLVAAIWRWRVERSRSWALLLAVQTAAVVTTLFQLRGAYAGALLGAPALAAAIGAARLRGTVPLLAAWAISAGILYPLAATALTQPPGHGTAAAASAADCASQVRKSGLAGLPTGMVMAPIDAGAWIIADTAQSAVAGPYHRDNLGNLAMYRFFLGQPRNAQAIAKRWSVRYVLACRSGLDTPQGSLLRTLLSGKAPAWLRPLPGSPGLYSVIQ